MEECTAEADFPAVIHDGGGRLEQPTFAFRSEARAATARSGFLRRFVLALRLTFSGDPLAFGFLRAALRSMASASACSRAATVSASSLNCLSRSLTP